MLVLSRDIEDEVMIICPDGQRIVFKYLDRKCNQISLGIEAPKEFKIIRRGKEDELELIKKILSKAPDKLKSDLQNSA